MKYKKQSSIKLSDSKVNNTPHKKSGKKLKKRNLKKNLDKKQKKERQENSLDELTRAFMKYVKESKNFLININDVVKKLKLKNRRIYDITNVLEGKKI